MTLSRLRPALGALGLAFACALPAQHPQAVTDCSNCHLDRATGMPDLQALHDFDCEACHPAFDFSRTILGSLGTWNHQCSACHNEGIVQTGNLPEFTKGHRCVVCHGQQMSTSNPADFHEEHAEKANCVVCHGFVPDVGTAIGSGNRGSCVVCHGSGQLSTSIQRIHREMLPERVNCQECHGGTRPPIDVTPGTPVGNAVVVCDICHAGASPTAFLTRGPELHRRHTDQQMGCGACHADANLQDDLELMPPRDDPRRAMVDRTGFNECAHCHSGGRTASIQTVHEEHVGQQAQWCHNCHEGMDPRPAGQAPPVMTPRDACSLCHQGRQYNDAFPFDVHEEHAEEGAKCYSCHQLTPPLTDWPARWFRRQGVLTTYGAGCDGSNGLPPAIGSTGSALLGRSFDVTLQDAAAGAPAVLALGLTGQVLDLTSQGMPGCSALVDPVAALLRTTSSTGTARYQQPVPPEPGLLGVSFHFQWFVLDPPANARGIAVSDGLRAAIGR